MSFASDTKKEICREIPENACCQKAQAYGLWLFTRGFSLQENAVVTENGSVARLMAESAAEEAGVMVEMSVSMHRKESGVYTLTIPGDDQRQRLLEAFGHTGHEVNLRLNRANLENDCCMRAFIRGAFLSCGTVTDPRKDYHLICGESPAAGTGLHYPVGISGRAAPAAFFDPPEGQLCGIYQGQRAYCRFAHLYGRIRCFHDADAGQNGEGSPQLCEPHHQF